MSQHDRNDGSAKHGTPSRRGFLSYLGAAPALKGLIGASLQAQKTEEPGGVRQGKPKPNIVLILMDNLGYGELGVYGGGILRGAPTPRIDKLASEGSRLLNFNVEAQCTPEPLRSSDRTVCRADGECIGSY